MRCEEIREIMPDVAAGVTGITPEMNGHLAGCGACSGKMEEFRQTMALLDEWKAPEPSPYFDVRLQARLREEMAKPQAGWLAWFRRPVLAAALTVMLGVGVGVFLTRGGGIADHGQEASINTEPPAPGTAVSDLETLEKNNDLYANFDLLDDLDLQQDVVANP
jgi:hypothetical protein